MTPTWTLLLPEIWLGTVTVALLLLDLRGKHPSYSRLGPIAAAAIVPVFLFIVWQARSERLELLGGMYRLDSLACYFKGIFAAAALAVIGMTHQMQKRLERGQAEFYLLILTALLGMFFAASSADFLMLFVSLELIAISFYVLTAYLHTNLRSLEAGLKYLILGSLASAFTLYGIAFVYGSTGSTHFSAIQQAVRSQSFLSPALGFGLLMITAGVAFKIGAVPFQLWVPDVYEGAPTPVTAFLSVGSKAAGLVMAYRLFLELFQSQIPYWSFPLAVLSGATLLYGNLGAIPQRNIKRFLGYSSIGHAGYLLMGFAAGSPLGAAAASFYLLSYLFTNLAVFLVVVEFSRQTGTDSMSDYAGLAKRSPFLAAAMFLALLSLAGVPPLAGFFGKFLLLLAVLREGYLWLAVIGSAAVVISLYYYLSLVKTMYADPPKEATPLTVSPSVRAALLLCLAAMGVIGIFQGPFLNLSLHSIRHLL